MTRRRTVAIESLGVYLPERVVPTSEVTAGCAVPLRMPLERLSGIRSHRRVAPGEYAIELADAAIADCLAGSGHAAAGIDLLISASISHGDGPGVIYAYEPCFAARLKARHGFVRAVAFDVSNGCAGLWTGVLIAETLIASGAIDTALVVSGEYITDLIRTAQREISAYFDPQIPSLTVGDSGAAVLLGVAGPGDGGFQAIDLYTLGRYAPWCVARPSERSHGGAVMLTDTLRLGQQAIEHAVPHLSRTLREAGWAPGTVNHLIPHQTSEMTLVDGLRRITHALGDDPIPAASYHINLAERGNTATTTHVVALDDATRSGAVRSGDRAAFVITGSGLTVGTALYQFDRLPGCRDVASSKAAVPAALTPRLALPVAGITATGFTTGEEARSLDSVELCRRAGEACLARAGVARASIEFVLHAGVYRADFVGEPATAALAAGALDLNAAEAPGAPVRTFAADLLAGHLGALKGLWTIDAMIRAGRYANGLLLTSDVEIPSGPGEPYGLDPSGSALLVERSERGALFELFHFRDFPEHLGELHATLLNPDGHAYLSVQRQPTFVARAAECLVTAAADLLEALGLPLEAFELVVMPGIPALAGEVAARLHVRERQLVVPPVAVELIGASLAGALSSVRDSGRATPGARALVLAAGAGIQTGCAILRFA